MAQNGKYHVVTWDEVNNNKRLHTLQQMAMTTLAGEKIIISPMNPLKHHSKHSLVRHPAVYYSIPYVIENADTIEESFSQDDRAIENRQIGKIMLYSKHGLLDKMGFPEYAGKTIINDIIKVSVQFDAETGQNYTRNYLIKIDTDD